jgi:hypothetical protein
MVDCEDDHKNKRQQKQNRPVLLTLKVQGIVEGID